MINDNPILGNQLVVMSRADLDALVEKMASNMIAMRVEDKNTHESDVCPVVHDDERFITRQPLHSWRLRFRHPISGKLLELTAPLPEDMLRLI